MNEIARIRDIESWLGKASARVKTGIGDDAAVCARPEKGDLLFCSDAMAEGIHFDLKYCSYEDIGHKAIAVNLSDIAAMNGKPLYAVMSLALPTNLPEENLAALFHGAKTIAKRFDLDIVGGDLTASRGGLFVDVAIVGSTEHPILRSGAKPGDLLAVSGFPGTSAAGLEALRSMPKNEIAPALSKSHLRPEPRLDLLSDLAKSATALIDISDGLSSEIHHIAERSNVGFMLDESKVPLHPEALKLAAHRGVSAFGWALSGGEDYELLATLDPTEVARSGVPRGFTVIGRATPAKEGVLLISRDGRTQPLVSTGFDHFASS